MIIAESNLLADAMSQGKDRFDTLTSETMRRAEEMCSGLSLNLSLDRRGQAKLYNGVVTDLDQPRGRNIPVVVAENGDKPWFTLVAEEPLEACRNALLVFRKPPNEHMKYVGRFKAGSPGQRGEEDRDRFVTTFDIIRDARKG
ncbi:MAG: hypothetical protein EA370_09555 [Wenzhouxiangella sp.]|nr:MAG: hypothetical protein EA370_09555 [Wenzhouxiangella sp.]